MFVLQFIISGCGAISAKIMFGSSKITDIGSVLPPSPTAPVLGSPLINQGIVSTPIVTYDENAYNWVNGFTVDSSGNLFVLFADGTTGGNCILKVTPMGARSTFAGDCSDSEGSMVDGVGTNARFAGVARGLMKDNADNMYLIDALYDDLTGITQRRVRKVTPDAVVSTMLWSDYSLNNVSVNYLNKIDRLGHYLYIASDNNGVSRINISTGEIYEFTFSEYPDSSNDGKNLLGFDKLDNIYLLVRYDGGKSAILKVSADASNHSEIFNTEDEYLTSVVDNDGNVFVMGNSDANKTLYKIDSSGQSTILNASVSSYIELFGVDNLGNLYGFNGEAPIINKIAQDGSVSVLAGHAYDNWNAETYMEHEDGIGAHASFGYFYDNFQTYMTPSNQIYLLDAGAFQWQNRIRKIE